MLLRLRLSCGIRTSLLFMAKLQSVVDVPSCLSTCLDGYLGCFHLLALVNTDAMNIHVEVSVWLSVFSSLGLYFVEFLGCMVTMYGDCQAISTVSTILYSHQQLREAPSSSLPTLVAVFPD